jgi:D-tyrosyl-tRNA(Tyr) deacylase
VLSDGPDPTADSVGYAQAQILPLKQLKLSTAKLQAAVTKLDAAYTAFVAAKSSSTQTQAAVQVTSAENAVNAICPGAAG